MLKTLRPRLKNYLKTYVSRVAEHLNVRDLKSDNHVVNQLYNLEISIFQKKKFTLSRPIGKLRECRIQSVCVTSTRHNITRSPVFFEKHKA